MKLSSLILILIPFLFLGSCKPAPTETPMQATFPETPTDSSFVELDTSKLLRTIAFGSCNNQALAQPIWPDIQAQNPDLWIWLGDMIYGDSEDMSVMKAKYDKQLAEPGYQAFYEQVPLIGIWDDHDYGLNDGGKEYPKKAETQQLMMDFLRVPEDAPQRHREGAYSSYTVGPEGKQVKIILLDARYFRDEAFREKGKGYVANPEGDILGEAQWKWLEAELENSSASVHLIASGIQIIPEEHRFEKWANFPKARKQLFDLIESKKVARPILLSGDRHIAEISRLELDRLHWPLFEITSSGLTHSYESVGGEANRHRVGKLIGQKNFGVLQLDWSEEKVQIRAEIRGLGGKLHDDMLLFGAGQANH